MDGTPHFSILLVDDEPAQRTVLAAIAEEAPHDP
jgi:CheY-like chemotaxis protein